MNAKRSLPSRSRAAVLLLLAGIFLLLLLCTHETDLIADDYRYCFSFADGSRIVRVGQIFPSMAAHRQTMNGRVFAHFLAQLFLMLPKPVFDVLNALLFTLLVWLTGRLADAETKPGAPLLFLIFAGFWCLQPNFGQVFLWLDGAVNYLWCAVLCTAWLLPWRACYLTGRSPSPALMPVYAVFSFVAGAYSENAAVALIAMGLLFLLLLRLQGTKRPPLWMLCSLAAALAGFLFMMLAPAESANKSAEMRLSVLLANTVQALLWYLRFWPCLLSFGLLYALALRRGTDRGRRTLALVYLFGSLAGHFVLAFALYITGRSTYIALVLLLAANAVLLGPVLSAGRRRSVTLLLAACLLFTAYRVGTGVSDILRTHVLLRGNEELAAACAAAGERSVQLYRPYAGTDYSALEGLPYLNTEDPSDWPNVSMAKYYGVEEIIGY